MLLRTIAKHSPALCRGEKHLLSEVTKCQDAFSPSAEPSFAFAGRCSTHMSTERNNRKDLRLEGIQGPLHASLSAKEGKRLLDKATRQANADFSPEGVQGNDLHTAAVGELDIDASACPQGVQGSTDGDADTGCAYLKTWLNNCRHYGLANCDQQLQGIQSGRLTLAQVLADQEARIAEIADSYRRRAQQLPSIEDESMQGFQGDLRLPDIDAPCPQGVQGDDCVHFKLWLENCHRFGLHECMEQLQGFQSGRVTLAQIFAEQEAVIRQVARQYQQRKN